MNKKRLIPFLIVMLVVLTFLPVTVWADEKTENGLVIEQTTDKAKYSAGDNIKTTLTVTNTNEHSSDVLEVKLANLTPDGYQIQKDSPAEKSIETLKAGESVSLTTVFVKKDNPAKTGDSGFLGIILAGVVAVFSVLMIVGVLVVKKKGKIKGIFLSCLLAAGLTAVLLGGAVVTYAKPLGEVSLTTVVSAEGKDLPVKSTVSYGARTSEKYQVTFDGNFEGSKYSEKITETCGSVYVLPANNPEREGYTFAGWFTEAEGGTQVTAETKVDLKAAQTLYAHWTKDPVKINKPTAAEGLTYNGEEQTGVAEGTGYTLANNKGTSAGDYTATATLSSGYCWQDGSTDPAEIKWTIGKASAKVKADDAEKTSGETDPELTATVTGTFGTDKLTYTVTRAEGESVGTYAITPSGDAVQGNYNVTYEAGTFTINPLITYTLSFTAGSGVDKLLDADEEKITDPVTVEFGSSYSFTVVLNSAYQKAVVTVGDDEISPSDDGVYTISNITDDMSVTAIGRKVGYYAVCIWNIEQMIDGSDLVTFGPAAGASYDDAIGNAGELEDSWEEIDAAARAGKAHTKYDDAMKNGDVKLIEITGNDYFTPSGTFSAFHSTVRSDYRKWNSTFAGYSSDDPASNYADSRIRATLNGYDNVWQPFTPNAKYAGTDCLTKSNCLLSCFPEELQTVITPKTYYVPAGWSTSKPYKITLDAEVTDKLWLANANEIYGSSAGAQYSDYGTMFQKNNGSPASANKLYRESGTATGFWLRSPWRSFSYQVATVMSSGEAEIYPCDSTVNAIAPFFNIGGAYAPEPVTTTYQLATDDNGSWLDDDDMLVSSITVGGTTPPTANETIVYTDQYGFQVSVTATPNSGYEFDGCTYDEATKTFTATFKAMAVPVIWTPMQKKISGGSSIDFYPVFNNASEVSGYKFAVKDGENYHEIFGESLSMADIYAALQPASGTKTSTLYYTKTNPDAAPLKGYTVINSLLQDVFKLDAKEYPYQASEYTSSFKVNYVLYGIVTAQLGDASGTNQYGQYWEVPTPPLQYEPTVNGVRYTDFYNSYGGHTGDILSSRSDLPWFCGLYDSTNGLVYNTTRAQVSMCTLTLEKDGIILATLFE